MTDKIVKGLAIGVIGGVIVNTVMKARAKKLQEEMYGDEIENDEHSDKE